MLMLMQMQCNYGAKHLRCYTAHIVDKKQAQPKTHRPKQGREGGTQGAPAPLALALGPTLLQAVHSMRWRVVPRCIQGIFPQTNPATSYIRRGSLSL
jgi:hypothetical protein